jgi:hypothetical protein
MVHFQTKNLNLGKFGGPRLENVDTFNGHFKYFTDIWDILSPFGTYCVPLVQFFQFWNHAPRKIWQPWVLRQLVLFSNIRHCDVRVKNFQ